MIKVGANWVMYMRAKVFLLIKTLLFLFIGNHAAKWAMQSLLLEFDQMKLFSLLIANLTCSVFPDLHFAVVYLIISADLLTCTVIITHLAVSFNLLASESRCLPLILWWLFGNAAVLGVVSCTGYLWRRRIIPVTIPNCINRLQDKIAFG